jgi:hypothetical protein
MNVPRAVTGMPGDGRGIRFLTRLLAVAVVVSIVHYTDNYVNFHDYPQSSTLPNPSAGVIFASWFAFTAAGIAGYLLYRRSASRLALVLLVVYSGSGLVGIGHYLVPGATSMPWWRQAHICLDIACGIAVFAFAVWAERAMRRARAGLHSA